MEHSQDYSIKLKKLTYLYDNLLGALISALAIAILMYFSIKDAVNIENLNIWLVSIILITLTRLITYKLYNETKINKKNISKQFFIFFILMLISSTIWSLIPLYIFPENIAYQVLLMLMFGGLATGASLSLAVEFKIFATYLSITMIPILVSIYIQDTEITTFITVTGLFYILFLLAIAKKISARIVDNIILVFNNEELIHKLKRTADEANNANEAKSKFLSVMSHEIRTPLNAIIGFVKILKKDEKNKIKQEYLETIDSSSFLLMSVINDVLDISKIESGNFIIEYIEYEPYKEFYSVHTLYENTSKQKGIKLINSISSELPNYLKGDILRVKQIISNLLSNAIKFTPKGKNIEFIVDFDKQTSSLHVEIRDEGIGIEKKNIKKVIQEFTQADDSTARKYGGTGLGLSIVTKLLELQNSKLEIKSEPNIGSSFYFDLPVKLSENINIQEEEHPEIKYNFHGKNILVAEDNKTNQMLIKILLDNFNVEVTIVEDGLEAENIFKEKSFDLILMDINMPNKNGTDAMLTIKTINKSIPIIALTANAVSGDKEKYIKEGFDNYLSKPIDNEELAKVLSKYLS